MEQQQRQRPAAGPAGRPRLTREQWLARRRRKRLRLIRNWVLFLSACGAAVGLMTGLILWVLPRAGALLGGRQEFTAPSYDLSGYVCDPADPYLVLVNNNLPLAQTPAPTLAVADDATGQQLEQAAAAAYRAMAAAAGEVGIQLHLAEGYQTPEQAQQAFDARKQGYLDSGMSDADADARAASIVPRPGCNESVHRPGGVHPGRRLRHDGLPALPTPTLSAGCRPTPLTTASSCAGRRTARAATGMVFEPWRWRYVGVENARAIAASGLSLEEFLAVSQLG